MRMLLATILVLGSALSAKAETYVYLSLAPEEGIQVCLLNPKDGSLTMIDTLSVKGAPGALAVDPSKKFLFASLRTNETLASFTINNKDGKLKPIGTVSLGKNNNAAFVAADLSGQYLLSASYSGARVVVHGLSPKGEIKDPPLQTVMTAKTAHCIAQDRSNRWVFVPHVAPNAVFQFHLDSSTGVLQDAGKAPGGAPGAGPRHLAFHPTANFAYTSDESGSSITAYSFDASKGLTPMQTLSTLPKGYTGKNSTAEVKVHPSGKFVWVSNRGHDSLAGFAIDQKTGRLTELGQTPTEKTPRSFNIDPAGRYLFSAGQGSGRLAVYSIDVKSGRLTPRHIYEVGKSLAWVMSVDLGK